METTAQNNAPKKSNKDFIWLLAGTTIVIGGLMLLKAAMHYFGLIG
ncbi:hypothetical protein [Mangrovibacterium sp.]